MQTTDSLTPREGLETTVPGGSSAIGRVPNRRAPWGLLVGLTLATLLVALAAAWHSRGVNGIIDADGWARLGFGIAEGNGLVDDRGRPTAFRGPVLPLVFALPALVFGPSYEAAQVTLCVLFAVANGLVGYLAWRYYQSVRVVLLTMLLTMAFYPAWPWFCHIFSEPAFAVTLAIFLLAWVPTMKSGSGWGFLATGLTLALAALCRPEMYAFVPFVFADILWKYGLRRPAIRAIALVSLGFFLLEGPWIARNVVVLGRPIISATAGKQNFFQATWYKEANWQGNVYHDPARFPPAAEGFWQLPDDERDKYFEEKAWENIREAPLSVLLCVPRRLLMFFFQLGHRGWMPSLKSLVLGLVLYGLAILGYLRASAEQRQLLNRALWIIFLLAAVHAALVSEFRYSHPVQPYILLMASSGILGILDTLKQRFTGRPAQPATAP